MQQINAPRRLLNMSCAPYITLIEALLIELHQGRKPSDEEASASSRKTQLWQQSKLPL